jgi:tetratricopeptide (TPR) repeat protein
MPVDYQRHPPQAQLMQVSNCMLLIAVPALVDWTARYRSGEELLEQGRTASAIRELQSALAECPDHPAILNALGDKRRAGSLSRQALELEPQNISILKVFAQALYLQKRYIEAKITLQKTGMRPLIGNPYGTLAGEINEQNQTTRGTPHSRGYVPTHRQSATGFSSAKP